MCKFKRFTLTAMTLAGFLALVPGISNAGEVTVFQKDKSFQTDSGKIDKLSVNTGDTIRFENGDPFFHNIFSLSDLKTFDLGSFPKGEFKTVTFDKPGLIEIECAIHPEMFLELTVK